MSRRIYTKDEVEVMEGLKDLKTALLLDDGRVYPVGEKLFSVAENEPNTLAEQVARIIDNSLFKRGMKNQGYETIEEANDFEMDDIDEPLSGYEIEDMPPDNFILPDSTNEQDSTISTKAEPESENEVKDDSDESS